MAPTPLVLYTWLHHQRAGRAGDLTNRSPCPGSALEDPDHMLGRVIRTTRVVLRAPVQLSHITNLRSQRVEQYRRPARMSTFAAKEFGAAARSLASRTGRTTRPYG